MPTLSLTKRLLAAFLFSALLTSQGCAKKAAEDKTVPILQQYFEQNILNRDFNVNYAVDINGTDSTDVTADYTGYTFKLYKNTTTNSNTDGPMDAKLNGIIVCTGTWSCTEEYGKLGINLTNPVTPVFNFLNRDWKFTYKGFPIMKLAPWGSASPKILYMERL